MAVKTDNMMHSFHVSALKEGETILLCEICYLVDGGVIEAMFKNLKRSSLTIYLQ